MAKISEFYGIRIYIYKEDGKKHKGAHFHAYYGDSECIFFLDGRRKGRFPKNKRKLVEVWMELRMDKLVLAWDSMSKGLDPGKISPLQ